MAGIRAVLAATDFSDGAMCAVQRAAQIASEHKATLTLLHVVDDSALRGIQEWLRASGQPGAEPVHEAQQKLQDVSERIIAESNLRLTVHVEVGDVVDALVTAAAHADLVVLGARGGNRLRLPLFGTTAERLIARSGTPALIVRQPCSGGYGKVLVPVDFSDHSTNALRFALEIRSAKNIVVFNACHEPFESTMHYASVTEGVIDEYRRKATQEAVMNMDLLRQGLGPDGRGLDTEVQYGHPASLILAQARKLSADLIVMGKHGRSKLEAFFIGSVTRDILAQAETDVLVVPE